ncbi:dipeptidyl peptidase IV N-terminal region-domain-containing protein [Panaeolus papilionaceus]|nr:dipeptidyl peptidase IV N-terminal region-domain-containing protein [Panaeolus papilionaceus]
MPRLSGEEGSPSLAGPSSAPEMRQKNSAFVDPLFVKPQVYYGEGPFDPPSSDDEDEATLAPRPDHHSDDDDDDLDSEQFSLLTIDKSGPATPGRAERGEPSPRRPEYEEPKKNNGIRIMAIVLIGLVCISGIIGIIAGFSYSGTSFHIAGKKHITIDHVFNGTFAAHSVGLNWIPEAGDGVYSVSEDGIIKLVDLKSNTTRNLVQQADVKDEHGFPIYLWDWKLSDDMKFLLVKSGYRKQWRWSSFGNYYIHDIEQKTTYPLVPPTDPSRTAYAAWSPTGNAIAYVLDNDLYLRPSADPDAQAIRISENGSPTRFNGHPDWVYEEEIFSSNVALWWSPDSKLLAFATFDESNVKEFVFPIYNPTDDAKTVVPYTDEVRMRYPKPGYENPLVRVKVFDLEAFQADTSTPAHGDEKDADDFVLTLDWPNKHPSQDSVIAEVAWVGNTDLIVKEVNRNADDGSVILFDLDKGTGASKTRVQRATGSIVRHLGKNGEQGDDGWIEHEQSIFPLPAAASGKLSGYLDIVPTPEGYNHIALFSPPTSSKPLFLTNGEWEVVGGIQGVDKKLGTVYFVAANPSIQRHVYSVPLPDLDLLATQTNPKFKEPTQITDKEHPGYYTTKFSPEAGFYVLSYHGPGIPWTRVVEGGKPDGLQTDLETNEHLKNVTREFESPVVTYSTITHEGYELNVKEMRPPKMDDSGRTKYPVLFRVYGGPGSQLVDTRFGRDWHDFVVCGMNYIVVTVDGRGTGYKGRKLRNPVKGNLGFFETKDQVEAAKVWAKKAYVDPKRIGIWGWSYGGFMSAKVVEADAGVHSLAMSVAPVTSWRLYDSIYTERYMNLPDLNPGGYINASITNVTGFRHADFLFAHGSGDDNVHYSNSAHLLDMLTAAGVRGFRFRMFTDSDHSINRRGGQREIYEFLTGFLTEKWGKGARKRY